MGQILGMPPVFVPKPCPTMPLDMFGNSLSMNFNNLFNTCTDTSLKNILAIDEPKARLITPTKTLIILHITKTKSNNCFIILLPYYIFQVEKINMVIINIFGQSNLENEIVSGYASADALSIFFFFYLKASTVRTCW